MPAPYEKLITYQQAEEIYDLTFEFCKRFVDSRADVRLREQMVQAGRSGKQNIAEGATAARTSLKSYIKLVSVARASLEELLQDYLDFSRQRKVEIWPRGDPRLEKAKVAQRAQRVAILLLSTPSVPSQPSLALNYLVDLLKRTNYLLDNQIRGLEQKFIREGGYSEQLFKKRLAQRVKPSFCGSARGPKEVARR